jgi:hypothetical protein
LLANAKTGTHGDYREPAPELIFEKFLASLLARATALAKSRTPTIGSPDIGLKTATI